jgi:hypothetical protein
MNSDKKLDFIAAKIPKQTRNKIPPGWNKFINFIRDQSNFSTMDFVMYLF